MNTGSPNADGTPDLDIGTDGDPGFVKDWSQNADAPLGAAPPKNQDQIDDIRIPKIGPLSPIKGLITALNRLRTNAEGHSLCRASTSGHFQDAGQGSLTCDVAAGLETAIRRVEFNASDVDADVNCELNEDHGCVRSGGNSPVTHAHLAVANDSNGQAIASDETPGSTSAEPGQTLRFRGTAHNSGDAASVAQGGTLTIPVPANTTFAGCSGCAFDGTAASWNLTDLQGGESESHDLLATVDAGTPAGTVITNRAVTDQDGPGPDEPVASNEVSVTVTALQPVTVQIQILGALSGVQPVAIFTTPTFDATTLVASSLRYGDCDDAPASLAPEAHGEIHPQDVDGDGDTDVMTHYSTSLTGFERGDREGCLTGVTAAGRPVNGRAPLPKGK